MGNSISELYFLSKFYEKKIHDIDIYIQFLENYIVMKQKGEYTLISIQEEIYTQHELKIPTTVISFCLEKISKNNDGLFLKDDVLTIQGNFIELEEKFKKFSQQFNMDSKKVFDMFNDFLKKSRHETLTFDSFQNILAIIKDRFAYTDYEFENEKINEECKLFLEFVGVIYSRSQYKEIQLKLNKILHSVLVYTFYTKISSEENIFSNKSIYIDTNIIIYLIGANLKFRKIYIEELLELLKLSKSKLLISKVTLLEFARTLKNPNNTYLKFFVENQRVKVDTILANPKSYIYELFSQYDIDIEIIDCDDIEKNERT